jgi:hypothetical protein
MDCFPLYSTLNETANTISMSATNMNKLAAQINKLNQDGKEKILVIIYIYYYEETKVKITEQTITPYAKENDMTWKISKMPNKLKWILWNFCDFHNKETQRIKKHKLQIEKIKQK